jgi:G3E family GTPase
MQKIPITILTGFLGSGKTTLLKRICHQNKMKSVLYLINDFTPNDVDGVIISDNDLNVKTLSGGSIFCNCKITDFVKVLQSIISDQDELDEVIIEASGISNPSSANTMLSESGLDKFFFIKSVICIVDCSILFKLIDSFPFIINQIESATFIILNKIDLAGNIDDLKSKIITLNSTAQIFCANFCDIDLNNINIDGNITNLKSQYSSKPGLLSYSIRKSRNIDYAKLKRIVSQSSIIRLKGIINIKNELYLVNYSGETWNIEKFSKITKPHLEIIFPEDDIEEVRKVIRSI